MAVPLTNITDFLASGNHFLPFFQTPVNCCQWKQFILQPEHIFLANPSFWLVETSFSTTRNRNVLFRVFFCQWKLLLKFRGSQFLKTNHIPASGHQIFGFFREFLKWKQLLRIVETYFSTNSLSGQWKRIFCLVETVFFDQSYFSASGNHYWNQGKTLYKERAYSCYWTPDIPGSRKKLFF